MGPEQPIDIFVSYPHHARPRVALLVRELKSHGLSVWWDADEIAPFSRVTPAIHDAIRRSSLFLVWYSADYPHRHPCQVELTSIFAAVSNQAASRILVVNPEPTSEHIHPIELRDGHFPEVDDLAGIADRARMRLAETPPRDRSADNSIETPWYGTQPSAFPRFVGRLPELWRIHSLLTAGATAITAGSAAPRIAQLRGLPGVGKSLLALEYARRFATTYPGGIFWLSAAVGASAGVAGVEEQRQRSFRDIAQALDIPVRKLTAAEIDIELAGVLARRDGRTLWIVDDLPESLPSEHVRKWMAPAAIHSLITTRSRDYSALGATLELEVLPVEDAAELLSLHRPPADTAEAASLARVIDALGQHPLALDIAGALVAATHLYSYPLFLEDLEDLTTDVLDLASGLSGVLPTGHDARIASTLGRSIDSLSADAQDVLRVSAVLSAAPVPEVLLFAALQHLWSEPRSAGSLRVVAALAEVDRRSLAERTDAPAGRRIHPLVTRTIARYHARVEHLAAARSAAVAAVPAVIAAHLDDILKDDVLSLCVQHARDLDALGDAQNAALLASLAAAYAQRAEHQRYRQVVTRRAALLEQQLGSDHFDTWGARITALLADWSGGPQPELLKSLHKAVDARRRLRGDADADVLESVETLTHVLWMSGMATQTRRLAASVRESCHRLTSRDSRVGLQAEHLWARYCITVSDPETRAAAMQALRRVLDTRRRLFGADDEGTLASLTHLTTFVDDSEARELAREVWQTTRAKHGEQSAKTAAAAALYASELGHSGEAAEICAFVLAVHAKVHGMRHERTTAAAWNYRVQLRALGREREADEIEAQYLTWTRYAAPSELRGPAPLMPALLDGRQITGTMLEDPEGPPEALPFWVRSLEAIDTGLKWIRRMRGRMYRPPPEPEPPISLLNQPEEVLWRLENPDGLTLSAVLFTHRLGTELRLVNRAGAGGTLGVAATGEEIRSRAARYREFLLTEGWVDR